MDEIETRLAALELWAIEVGAFIEPQHLADAHRAISSGLGTASGDERNIRLGALGLIEDAQRRWSPPAEGLFVPGEDP